MTLDLTVSIVTYCEDPEKLSRAVSSVIMSHLNIAVYIVDNSPTATIRDHVPTDPRVHYLHRPDNPGFGSAHNLAIRKAGHSAPFHLVLNPDVEFDPSILGGMIEFLAENPKVGLVAPKVFYPNGEHQPLCKLLPTPCDVILRRLFPDSRVVQRRNARYTLLALAYEKTCKVPSISGCFMLFRSESLWDIGLFDERFFMYFEDVDISRRMTMRHNVVFLPAFKIIHDYRKGSYKSSKLFKIHIMSCIRYFNKWGWLFDSTRRQINIETLKQFNT